MIPIQMRGGGRLVPVASANFLTTTSLPSWLTWTDPAGHRTMFDTSGYLTWAPNNLLLNTATLSTQNVTTVVSNYVLSFKGTGTVTLSGTSTAGPLVGTGASNRVNLAFTPTAGTLTLTVSGSVTNARLSRVTYETTMRTGDDVETTGSAYYGPRFDYDPATLAARGLLIEESRENLLLRSNTFSDAAWTNVLSSGPTANVTGPDNVANSAWTFPDTDGAVLAYLSQGGLTLAAASTYTFSAFVKRTSGATNFPAISFLHAAGGVKRAGVNIDTNNAAVSVWTSHSDTLLAGSSADCEIINSNWMRAWVTFTTTDTDGIIVLLPANRSTFNGTGTGDVTVQGSAVFYGAQLELGSYPTSYIPTTTAAVTRNAETVTFAGTAQTALQSVTYSSAMEFVSESSSDASRLIGNTTNTASPVYRVSSTAIGAHNGTTSLSAATAVSFDLTTYRVAYGQSASGRSITSNNTAVSTGTDANYTAANAYTWRIGQYSGSEKWSGWVRGLSFYNVRLSDAQLQAKSTVGGSY